MYKILCSNMREERLYIKICVHTCMRTGYLKPRLTIEQVHIKICVHICMRTGYLKPRLTIEQKNMKSNVTMLVQSVQISLIHLPVAASESFLSSDHPAGFHVNPKTYTKSKRWALKWIPGAKIFITHQNF